MASLESDISSGEIIAEKCAQGAMDIVFSFPELSRDEQVARLLTSVTTDFSGIPLKSVERAISSARMTF